MPIYIKVDDIKGAVTAEGHSFNTGAANAVPVSRISLAPGVGGVEGRDVAAKVKVEQLIRMARSQASAGKLYVATDAGVYQNAGARFNGQGRLLIGTDNGTWRSGGAAERARHTNNLKQLGLGCHNTATVEIIVTDASGSVVGTHRLEGARASRHPGGINVIFGDGSVKF